MSGAGEAIKTFTDFHAARFISQLKGSEDPLAASALTTLQKLVARAGVPPEELLLVACDRNGRPWRKHQIEVRDIMGAFRQIFKHQEATFGKTYQIGSARPWDLAKDIPYIAEKLGRKWCRLSMPLAPTYYEYDMGAARRDFGYAPELDIHQVIDEALAARAGTSSLIPTTAKL